GLRGRAAAARIDADGAAGLPGFRRLDHGPGAAPGWRGGTDRPRDLFDAVWPRGVAPSVRGPCPRSDRGHRRRLPLYDRSDRAASAATETNGGDRRFVDKACVETPSGLALLFKKCARSDRTAATAPPSS